MNDCCHLIEINGVDLRLEAFKQQSLSTSNDAPKLQTFFINSDNLQFELEKAILDFEKQFSNNDKNSNHFNSSVFEWSSQWINVEWGRKLFVLRQHERRFKSAVFQFEELCDRPLGASDYASLARHFDIIGIENVPKFSLYSKDVAKRFVLLVDEFYNNNCVLFASAETTPQFLFDEKEFFNENLNEIFEQRKTKLFFKL